MASLTITVKDGNTGNPIRGVSVGFWVDAYGDTCDLAFSMTFGPDFVDSNGKVTLNGDILKIGDTVGFRVVEGLPAGYKADRCHEHKIWKDADSDSITLWKTEAPVSPTILDYDFSPTSVKYLESVDVSIKIRNDGGDGNIYARVYDDDTGKELGSTLSFFTGGQIKWLSTVFGNIKKSGAINCRLEVGDETRYFSVSIIEAIFDIVGVTTDKSQYEVGEIAIITVKIKNIGNIAGSAYFDIGLSKLGCYQDMVREWTPLISPNVTYTRSYEYPLTAEYVGTQSISVELVEV